MNKNTRLGEDKDMKKHSSKRIFEIVNKYERNNRKFKGTIENPTVLPYALTSKEVEILWRNENG